MKYPVYFLFIILSKILWSYIKKALLVGVLQKNTANFQNKIFQDNLLHKQLYCYVVQSYAKPNICSCISTQWCCQYIITSQIPIITIRKKTVIHRTNSFLNTSGHSVPDATVGCLATGVFDRTKGPRNGRLTAIFK